ncbi:MAG: hypothetical protein HOI53_08490 [Francisellaceae bacterium]|nr:hypothetical protein [Francisellaceae bacterium]MBT6208053.1 hypothetical protein [Francisellaceae bacterium]MBT6539454.1 hypothetical protein [Francisellaceae bacterium]
MNVFLFAGILVFIQFSVLILVTTYVFVDKYFQRKNLKIALLDFSIMLGKEHAARKKTLEKFLKESLSYDDDTVKIVTNDVLKAEDEFNTSFLAIYNCEKINISTLKIIREEYLHVITLYQSLLPQVSPEPEPEPEPVTQNSEPDIEFDISPDVEAIDSSKEDLSVNEMLRQESKVMYVTYLESKALTSGFVRNAIKDILDKLERIEDETLESEIEKICTKDVKSSEDSFGLKTWD